jgi:hypothetical protein
MKKLTAYLVITSLLFLAACKEKDKTVANDPRAVISAFFERMAKKDLDGAAKLATKESKPTLDMMKKAIEAGEKMGITDTASKDDPSDDFKKMEIGEVKIDGDNATVSVTNHAKSNETTKFPLKKEGGEWKVDFSMATLMKMGMDEAGKMKNENGTGDDTTDINKALKDLMNNDTVHIDADSTSH